MLPLHYRVMFYGINYVNILSIVSITAIEFSFLQSSIINAK